MGKVLFSLLLLISTLLFLTLGILLLTRGNTLGADFYIYYMAGRAGLIERISPYDPNIVQNTQLGILGHPATQGGDQLAFVYPAFALLPLAPFFLPGFSISQAAWMALNITLVSMLILTISSGRRRLALIYLLFYPVASSMILGNLNGMVSLIILFVSSTVILPSRPSRPAQLIGGAALGWAIVKPQFCWLFLLYFLWVALQKKHHLFLFSFGLAFIILFAGSLWYWPGWVPQWITAAERYTGYVQATFTIHALFKNFLPGILPPILAMTTALVSLIFTLFLFRRSVFHPAPAFTLFTLGWIGFTTYLFHPNGTSYEQMTMFVPFLLWFLRDQAARPWARHLWWLGALLLSWVAFFLTFRGVYPRAVYDPLILFFALWMFFLYKQNARQFLTIKEALHANH
uniref:DUF2029 domain-containing protein n=1 Tax=Anaerolinea thermolimosa TaxID=229919 RepID=A0A7C4PL93_9CHLR